MTAHLSIVPTPVVPVPEGGWEPLEPGVYYDVSEAQYRADPALSQSSAKRLLKNPARVQYEQTNPQPSTTSQEFGSALHTLVLGTGTPIRRIEADSYARNTPDGVKAGALRELRDEIRSKGEIPLLIPDWDKVHAMAEAVQRHPVAAAAFHPDAGQTEVVLVWECEETGVMCKGMIDKLWVADNNPTVNVDLKSIDQADPWSCARQAAKYGYGFQGATYCDGLRTLGLADGGAETLLVFQEKTAPYSVSTLQFPREWVLFSEVQMMKARRLYADLVAKYGDDPWPAYSDRIEMMEAPSWLS